VAVAPPLPLPLPLLLLLLCTACVGALLVRGPRCRLGSDPGHWARTRWDALRPGRGLYPYYNRLDGTNDSVWLRAAVEPPDTPFGSAWRTVEPECQPANLLTPFLGQAFVRNVTIVLLGDSVDAQLLDFACGEAAARNVTGWAAFVHSHSVVNYCSLPSGLHLVQMYVQRHGSVGDLARINTTRAFIMAGDDDAAYTAHDARVDRNVLRGRREEARAIADAVTTSPGGRPSLVVYSASHYWVLLGFAGAHRRDAVAAMGGDAAAGEAAPAPDVLSEAEIALYMSTTSELLGGARAAFPHTHLVTHTSPEVRTGCEDGVQPLASEKSWARKPYVAALNAALRALAARSRTPVWSTLSS
jgi:hypothetical protein